MTADGAARRRAGLAVASAGVLGVAGTLAGAMWWRRLPEPRRLRLRRSARIWRLSARRAAHLGSVKVRSVGSDAQRRDALEADFAIRTAQDVAAELGQMKGVLMKLGQLASVIADGLPPEARQALASLQADVPPMDPALAADVVRAELGAGPEQLFRSWDPMPVAAASIGQVHRAVTSDGRTVAVKVQYPGAADAIAADLDNAELLYSMVASVAYRGLDAHAVVDELRQRMGEELDYRTEAANQTAFAERFAGHPFITVPTVVTDLCSQRVLTTEWAEGTGFAEVEAATDDRRQYVAEVLFRFAQASVHHHREFNGDPHPGNYRFAADGSVAFVDFGLVKRWDPVEFAHLMTVLDPVLAGDPEALVERMQDVGFLRADARLDPQRVYDCVAAPYEPYLTDEFTFTPSFTTASMRHVADPTGEHRDVVAALSLPPSFVVLNRVVWGMSGLLGRLEATNRWGAILDEYRHGAPPATALGAAEARWVAARQISGR
ncbi:MAG: AarF/ABC1/UbiB kinase family protein [Acidimicrobiia bacterium]|nr:AarF/ABC1/UbiB kinase family protein [Acidimicrobiia bacterium]